MKRTFLILAAALTVFVSAPAFACSCLAGDTDAAAAVINDPSISVAKVYVRGMNPRNGQSMLELKETRTGGLMARNFRAKFDNKTSCGVVPQPRQTQILVIKFEKDGTYSIVGECTHGQVLGYLKNHPQ